MHRDNLFKENDPTSRMDFDVFKKQFFPQLFHVHDDSDSENDKKEMKAMKETNVQ